MKFTLLLIFVAVSATAVYSQSRTITNADLEKFKQKRLAAEKELRENYRELGFPSPEERERDLERSRRELSQQSERLRRQRIARERANRQTVNVYNTVPERNQRGYYYNGRYFPGVIIYGRGFFRRPWNKRPRRQVRRGPGFIRNPYIRQNWLRQSRSMRQTYAPKRSRRQ